MMQQQHQMGGNGQSMFPVLQQQQQAAAVVDDGEDASEIGDSPPAKKATTTNSKKKKKKEANIIDEGSDEKESNSNEGSSIVLQARLERNWEVEKAKHEMAFNDMSKEMRDELRTMRDKYDSIVKFDAAIHITLVEHRERLKQKQDECDHYIDTKLYEKQKIFDRDIAEVIVNCKYTKHDEILHQLS